MPPLAFAYPDAVSGESTNAGGERPYTGERSIVPHQDGGHGAHRVAAYFLRSGLFGSQQSAIAAIGLASLVEGAGNIDPVAGLAFGGGQGSRVDAAGVLDGLPGIAEQIADRDLMQEDLAGTEGGTT